LSVELFHQTCEKEYLNVVRSQGQHCSKIMMPPNFRRAYHCKWRNVYFELSQTF